MLALCLFAAAHRAPHLVFVQLDLGLWQGWLSQQLRHQNGDLTDVLLQALEACTAVPLLDIYMYT